jgi:hypothetical protein
MARGIGWAVLPVVALLVSGCGTHLSASVRGATSTALVPLTTTAVPAPDGPSSGVMVVPPSAHVTGVYPGRCYSPDARHPDPTCTPGAVQSDITQTSIASTICRRGWTATVRAPEAETGTLKKAAMLAYGQPAAASPTTELDHFVPLELGGANDVHNLWPEPSDDPGHGTSNTKDSVEIALNHAVCSGRVPLAAAQHAIATDWTTAEQHLGLTP